MHCSAIIDVYNYYVKLMKVITRKKCRRRKDNWHQLVLNPGQFTSYHMVSAAQS